MTKMIHESKFWFIISFFVIVVIYIDNEFNNSFNNKESLG